MTNIKGEDGGSAQSLAEPSSFHQHNYFAVPFRGQLAGRPFVTTPSHVRSPLAQTPSSMPSDDNPPSPGPSSIRSASFPARGDVTDNLVTPNDDPPPPSKPPTNQVADAADIVNPLAAKSFTHYPDTLDSLSWPDFLEKYAEGKWDPSRAPSMPKANFPYTYPSRKKRILVPTVPEQASPSHSHSIDHQNASDSEICKPTPLRLFSSGPAQSSLEATTSDAQTITQRRGGGQLVLANFEPPSFHGAAQEKRTSTRPRTPSSPAVPTPSSHITPSAVADAATVRWAGARVKIAPLALSSPERELLDPLSDYVAGLPTPQQKAAAEYFANRASPAIDKIVPVSDPRTSSQVPNVVGCVDTPPQREDTSKTSSQIQPSFDEPQPTPPISTAAPATPPLGDGIVSDPETPSAKNISDYAAATAWRVEQSTTSLTPLTPAPQRNEGPESHGALRGNPTASQLSLNAQPAEFCITGTTVHRERYQHSVTATAVEQTAFNPPASPALIRTKEEHLYLESGYLAAPNPPNELDRRTALHKFNILHTAPDADFDRIAHLAKLVFHTKWVLISLVDKDEQFLKYASGLPFNTTPRDISFCSHTILQDDPLIVLNTGDDWRFANNPMVDTPNDPSNPDYFKIAFYAGTPLRTSDGFNVGSLCVIDDVPRVEFTPRQKHTLKEFGAIVMREMELWRDRVQLRVRDRIQTSMEQFTRECLELDRPASIPDSLSPDQNMKRVYTNAASLVRRTLDLEGAVVVDVSNFEVLRAITGETGSPPPKRYHGNLFKSNVASSSTKTTDSSDDAAETTGEKCHEYGRIPPLPVLGSAENSTSPPAGRDEPLSGEAHARLASFLATYPDGRVYEHTVPSCFRGIVPANLQYAMVVPIFNVDGQPFILLFGYTTDRTKHYLEGFEMQYLRAIGVIILSAVLKRRMKLADKAKSLFISNISHELRTPLHGILAAAELLAESGLTPNQRTYLQTVEACGASLVETVNHVLDFSKLSGTSKSMTIKRTTTDLISLLEDTVESSWVGARARAVYSSADIGSAYSPPKRRVTSPGADVSEPTQAESSVETILDVGFREEGWILKCEKGGIRRILMNLMGNSLKFTDRGFVHITLRELPPEPGSSFVRVELGVLDTGKGISKDFLKNQMFQPFSQENPLHTGTGLGLAIVNSIVKSDGIRGKVDVYSTEGVGTEIRVTIETELPSRTSFVRHVSGDAGPLTQNSLPTVKVFPAHFNSTHRGQKLLREVLSSYIVEWWGAKVTSDLEASNVLLVNEDFDVFDDLITRGEAFRPIVLLASHRGDNELSTAVSSFERIGGLCCVVYKPVRPSHLYSALERAISTLTRSPSGSPTSVLPTVRQSPLVQPPSSIPSYGASRAMQQNLAQGRVQNDSASVEPEGTPRPYSAMRRRHSEGIQRAWQRPTIHRSITHHPIGDTLHESSPCTSKPHTTMNSHRSPRGSKNDRRFVKSARVLVVEDNDVNRTLLTQWLRKQGFEFEEATDGQAAVDVFRGRPAGHFDVVLVDMSMPVLDGVGAIQLIRDVEKQRYGEDNTPSREDESERSAQLSTPKRAKILALSGLASKEDKLRAFNAGVDGYLVKPVSFKTLAQVFARLHERNS